MVSRIQAYKDTSGKIHEDEYAAHKADLTLWLAKQESINETSAKQLAERIAGDPSELMDMLKAMQAAASMAVAPDVSGVEG